MPLASEFITFKFFEAFEEILKNWSKYMLNTDIIIIYPSGNITKITRQFLLKLIQYSRENQHFSILQV